jgi:hypothetical protein
VFAQPLRADFSRAYVAGMGKQAAKHIGKGRWRLFIIRRF